METTIYAPEVRDAPACWLRPQAGGLQASEVSAAESGAAMC